jgi:F-type H+-transporting ATPase subunit b
MPQLDFATFPSQLFWLAVTFAALYVVVVRLVIPRTGGVIARRKATVEGDLAQAQTLKLETDQAIAAYEAALAEARARAHGIAAENRGRLEAEIDGERGRLEAALAARIAEAERRIAAAKNKALADVKDVAADLAASIVGELVGVRIGKEAAAAAVAKAGR